MVRKLQTLFIILFIPIAGIFFYAEKNNTSIQKLFYRTNPVMHIGDFPVHVEIVNTKESRTQGLSGRNGLGSLNGMLFVFDESDFHGIWMKDMLFPVDIIWISEQLEVVSITENVTPDTYPRVFEPPQKIKYLVETRAGYADTVGIHAGHKVVIPNKYLQ